MDLMRVRSLALAVLLSFVSLTAGVGTAHATDGVLPAQAVAGCATDYVYPPKPPNGYAIIGTDGQVHGHSNGGAIWFEPHFCMPEWSRIVNGLPFWHYVLLTRIDQPTDVEGHYGTCQPGRSCVRLYDGFMGSDGYTGITNAWECRPDLNNPHPICSSVAVTFNDSYLSDGAIFGNDTDRGRTQCHEYGHSVGLEYHRGKPPSTLDTTSCMNWATTNVPSPLNLNGADIGYLNAEY